MRLLLAVFCIVIAQEFYDEHRAYDLGEQYATAAESRLVERFKEGSAEAAQIPRGTTDEGRGTARPTRRDGVGYEGQTFDVERRLQRTYAIRRGAAVFVQAVLLVRFQECDATGSAPLAVLKIATAKGGPHRTEAMVQTRVSWAVAGLVPRVFEWAVLDRSPHTTTFGMLMEYLDGYQQLDSLEELRPTHLIRTADAVAKLHAAGYRHGDLCLWNVLWSDEEDAVRLIDFTVGRKCDPCDDDLIIIEEDNLEALSRGTDFSPDEAWADAVAAMGPDRARMFSSDADVEPVPGLGFGLGVD